MTEIFFLKKLIQLKCNLNLNLLNEWTGKCDMCDAWWNKSNERLVSFSTKLWTSATWFKHLILNLNELNGKSLRNHLEGYNRQHPVCLICIRWTPRWKCSRNASPDLPGGSSAGNPPVNSIKFHFHLKMIKVDLRNPFPCCTADECGWTPGESGSVGINVSPPPHLHID
jgi:hypothetical protein